MCHASPVLNAVHTSFILTIKLRYVAKFVTTQDI